MPLKISADLKKSIAAEKEIEKSDVEDYVWNHKPNNCFLCSGKLNRAADAIELDHNIPSAEDGIDSWDNLNLTHAGCNRYKRNHSSIEVRPHLQFKRFWENKSGAANFKSAKEFYKLGLTDCFVKTTKNKKTATIETELGKQSVSIYHERVGSRDMAFCFAELPISCIVNDDKIQPRYININHLLSIATDLTKNPLHEQPACRLVGDSDKKSVLMFDGQHKTVANLINGRTSLVFKLYLDISIEESLHLVNSIQSRIKKLPLTPFELATKMSDEVARQIEAYEEEMGSQEVSEAGFIAWLDPASRARAKAGIASAVIDRVVSDQDLAFARIIERKGLVIDGPISLKEAAFQKNILKKLLFTKPLSEGLKGEAMKQARERETKNVVKLLNKIYERGFVEQPDADPEQERHRIGRLGYQASLAYMTAIIRQLMSAQMFPSHDDLTFVEEDVPQKTWDIISGNIDRFFDHPVWTADLTRGIHAKAVQEAFSKNQNVETAFRNVGLTGGYCARNDRLPTNWAGV
ncbi:hypothetical protein HFP51_00310 [Parasphingopyxis sp. CP4]|uniref:HNH endonuclease n=1 Tax=Parasphingopyxis sp. CP4 TaxID=2724527 RepID=UPI0015A43C4F|nr:HNH endonuclease [Parasphingopyxis sp. CP4]QLC20760.1 hypothetical protein HFP51_00310 [Parasphingopyxis sp. CP4]